MAVPLAVLRLPHRSVSSDSLNRPLRYDAHSTYIFDLLRFSFPTLSMGAPILLCVIVVNVKYISHGSFLTDTYTLTSRFNNAFSTPRTRSLRFILHLLLALSICTTNVIYSPLPTLHSYPRTLVIRRKHFLDKLSLLLPPMHCNTWFRSWLVTLLAQIFSLPWTVCASWLATGYAAISQPHGELYGR